jgi:hypothetical protein
MRGVLLAALFCAASCGGSGAPPAHVAVPNTAPATGENAAPESGAHGACNATNERANDPEALAALALCREREQDTHAALTLYRKALTLAAPGKGGTDAHHALRLRIYTNLARSSAPAIALPALDTCAELVGPEGCRTKLWACTARIDATASVGARIATSRDRAQIGDAPLNPIMPNLGITGAITPEAWASSHNWSERAEVVDIFVTGDPATCELPVVDACLGLVSVVCQPTEGDAETVDEFYLWQASDGASPKER